MPEVGIAKGRAAPGKLELSQADERLPKFKKPPVVEVVMGTQFAPLAGMHVGHIGLLWERLRAKFPHLEQQPKLPHVIERRGVQQAMPPSISFLPPSEMIPRVWLRSANDSELIQVQNDRFTRNWRRYHDDDMEYPSYDGSTRPGFIEDFDKFQSFVDSQKLGPLAIDQCEMIYINHIRPCGVWSEFSQFDRVFKGWSLAYPHLGGSPAGVVGCRTRHDLVGADGNFVGHLFLEIDSAYSLKARSESGEPLPILQLQLTVRGKPLGEGPKAVMEFMDFAHRVIVKSFAEVTTSRMQEVWERTQ
jgi:hypothetical protein